MVDALTGVDADVALYVTIGTGEHRAEAVAGERRVVGREANARCAREQHNHHGRRNPAPLSGMVPAV